MIKLTPGLYSICLARFRFIESDKQKLRPVIIVSNPQGSRQILIVIPISASAKSEAIDVILDNWKDNGLLNPSVARVHRLSAMLQQDLVEEIGFIDKPHQTAIKLALAKLLSV